MPLRYAKIVVKNIMKKKISIGPAGFTSLSGVEKCGGVVENGEKSSRVVNSQNTSVKMMKRTTCTTRQKKKSKKRN